MTALHDAVYRGSLTWAVRDSLLRYVAVTARGSYVLGDGTTVTDDGAFTFPLRNAVQVGNEWRLSFGGSVRFTAHHGLLDIRIAEPEIVTGPQGGVLSVRTSDDGASTTAVAATGAEELGRDGADIVWTANVVHLLESGVELFGGVYPARTDLAPLKIRASLDS